MNADTEKMLRREDEESAYTIGGVSRILSLCADTLRIWEKKGLIKPRREGKNRIYSKADIERLSTIKELIRQQGLNVAGVRKVLGPEGRLREPALRPPPGT